MARDEHRREDLLAEATALVERIGFGPIEGAEPVVVGFRRDGAASLFFGDDTAYHFNAQRELRRAYLDGTLFKAERGALVALTRTRTATEVQLIRREVTPENQERMFVQLQRCIDQLRKIIESGQFHVTGQVPADVDLVTKVSTLLTALAAGIAIAQSPRVR